MNIKSSLLCRSIACLVALPLVTALGCKPAVAPQDLGRVVFEVPDVPGPQVKLDAEAEGGMPERSTPVSPAP